VVVVVVVVVVQKKTIFTEDRREWNAQVRAL
jgi:hypothetical protein